MSRNALISLGFGLTETDYPIFLIIPAALAGLDP
jgi:hypothetical protein